MSGFWSPGAVGRPDPQRQRRAQRLIERFHAGLIDAAAYMRGLQALFVEEISEEIAGQPPSAAGGRPAAVKEAPGAVREPVGLLEPVPDPLEPVPDPLDDPDEVERIRRMFPTRDDAPGLWLVLGDDRCHFCGRHLPVLALKASGDDPGGWVHICLDDLELIRAQAEGALDSG